MNQKAHDLLVQAWLNKIPQIKYAHAIETGRCALGVLFEPLILQRQGNWGDAWEICKEAEFDQIYGLTPLERHAIVYANNNLAWSFLDIARKFLAPDASANPEHPDDDDASGS